MKNNELTAVKPVMPSLEGLPQEVLEKFIALQVKCDALAAENAIQDFIITAVKDLVRESEGVTGWHLNGDVASWDEVLPELSHSETPATDAAIAEIKAQGVDEFVSELAGKIRLAGGEDGYSLVNYGEYADHLESKGEDFAANLRTGRKG